MLQSLRRREGRSPDASSSGALRSARALVVDVGSVSKLRALLTVGVALAVTAVSGCIRAPSPLAPQVGGSVGMPHRGVLVGGKMLPKKAEGLAWLRQDDRHWGLPRFVDTIERSAAKVARERPGAVLVVGDLSAKSGGVLLPHLSHRTGRDVDLLLYMTTLDGVPVASPGFVHVGDDGLAWDPDKKRFLRFDVEREWLLVKELVSDPAARVQWIFAHRRIEAMIVEWARAKDEPPELVLRAMEVMLQPNPGGPHDDHLHVRTACAPDELTTGCEPTGPKRAWLEDAAPAAGAADALAEPAP